MEREKPFLTQLRELPIGDSLECPVSKRSYVNVACTRFGLEWGKVFKTETNRETMTVKVTRTA